MSPLADYAEVMNLAPGTYAGWSTFGPTRRTRPIRRARRWHSSATITC
jgi:hypothetical protein